MRMFFFIICTSLALTVFAEPSLKTDQKQSTAENKSKAKPPQKKKKPKEELVLRSFEQLKKDAAEPTDPHEKQWKELNIKIAAEKSYTPPSQTEQWQQMEQDRPGELPAGFRDPITKRPDPQFLMNTKLGGY